MSRCAQAHQNAPSNSDAPTGQHQAKHFAVYIAGDVSRPRWSDRGFFMRTMAGAASVGRSDSSLGMLEWIYYRYTCGPIPHSIPTPYPLRSLRRMDFSLGTVEVALSPLQRFEEYLQSRGKRVTQQRRYLVEQIAKRHEHFDADQLILELSRKAQGRRVSQIGRAHV